MKVRFGLCPRGHLDVSNFRRKGKSMLQIENSQNNRATGITLLYKTLKTFWREVDWNRFSDEGERLKMRGVGVGSDVG